MSEISESEKNSIQEAIYSRLPDLLLVGFFGIDLALTYSIFTFVQTPVYPSTIPVNIVVNYQYDAQQFYLLYSFKSLIIFFIYTICYRSLLAAPPRG